MPILGIPLALWVALSGASGPAPILVEGTPFQARLTRSGATLSLHRARLFRYLGVIKAYSIALYLPEGRGIESLQADLPRRLELCYRVPIKGGDFGKGAAPILKRQHPAPVLAAFQERPDRINTWYRDVRPGDRYALTYLPGVGTELALNDQVLGVIEGFDFAQLYFGIWLAPGALDEALRKDLLGKP